MFRFDGILMLMHVVPFRSPHLPFSREIVYIDVTHKFRVCHTRKAGNVHAI